MPTWSGIAKELEEAFVKRNEPPFDYVRRKYLVSLSSYTGRNCILYATSWTQPGKDPNAISITEEDIQGLMEVIHGLHIRRARRPPVSTGGGIARIKPRTLSPRGSYLIDR